MELYVKVSFWIGAICFIFHLCEMAAEQWPKVETVSLGKKVARTLLSLAFTIWAGLALWA